MWLLKGKFGEREKIRRLGLTYTHYYISSQVAQIVKNLTANAGATEDADLIPGLGRSPGGGNGNPLQYPCLGNSMDREAWWTIVYGVAKNQT